MKSKNLLTIAGHPELPLARKPERVNVPNELVFKQQSLGGAIALCVQLSGLEEKEVYLCLGIDAGHWTRIMKGDAHFPVNKLNDLMDICGNETPLIWLTNSRGYGLILLKSEAERRADKLEEQLAQERIKNRVLVEALHGRVA